MTTDRKSGSPRRRPADAQREDREDRGSSSTADAVDAVRVAVSRGQRMVPTLAALLTGLAGLLALASAVTPTLRERARALHDFLPVAIPQVASAGTLMAGLLLLLLARGLRRRKRRAWRGAVGVLALLLVLHLVKGLDVEEAAATGLVLALLVATRDQFTAKGDPRTRRTAMGALAGLLAADVVLGQLIIQFRESRLVGSPGMAQRLRHVLLGLVGIPGPVQFETGATDQRVHLALAGLGLVTALVTVYLVLRPGEPVAVLAAEDEQRMRELLDRHGHRDSLGYFALRRDKSVVWSATGKSCIAYRVVSGVMLASGDPIGDPEAWPGAITRFLQIAAEHAWVPAVMGCSEPAGTVYARHGLAALEIGDEAVVDPAAFSLDGRAMRGVRQAVGRVERAGYVAQVRRARDIPRAELAGLARQAQAWRGSSTERGFSMALGRFGDPGDDGVVVSAEQEGHLRGLLAFVPWGRDGLSLDLMIRDRAADNGLNEFLIVTALRSARDLGVKRVSLNFAVFRDALERGGKLGAGPVLRAWRGVLLFFSRWFQIDSLYRFNAKFQPAWQPRYVCYPTSTDLPRIALAALEAEAFLVMPRLPFRRRKGCEPVAGELAAEAGAAQERPVTISAGAQDSPSEGAGQ